MTALLTDLYQLTMLQGYLEQGKQQDTATFELYYRTNPFEGGYAIAAGLETALREVLSLSFDASDLEYLSSLKGTLGTPLFKPRFLEYLRGFKFKGQIRAIPEGTVVFPNLPLMQVEGDLLEAQLLETLLLCHIGFQTLVATKTSRIKEAAGGAPVIEFGLRRAQGPNGAMAGARAMRVGGGDATSNVLAGKVFGIPVRGTHAHSWVMSFDSELEAFRAYAHTYPDDTVLLVDTYDTLASGVPNAIRVAAELRQQGHSLRAIRLDSGDLTYLSIKAREMLDEAGFPEVKILASNDLDEQLIADLRQQGARIDLWGVGTRLIAAQGKGGGALGCVYKLVDLNGDPRIKRSSQVAKTTNPGRKDAVRLYNAHGEADADVLLTRGETLPTQGHVTLVDPANPAQRKGVFLEGAVENLLVSFVEKGELVRSFPSLDAIAARRDEQIRHLHPSYRRLLNPHVYKVGLSEQLWALKARLLELTTR